MRILYDRPVSLQRVAQILGLGGKIASGLDAIYMARDGRWEELEAYCMQDAKLTWQVAKMLQGSVGLESIFDRCTYI